MAPGERRIPGEAQTERFTHVADTPRPKPALPAATPGAVRAALVFGSVMFAHLMLGLTQPHAAQSETFMWAMLAFAATAITGVVGMYVGRAEGFRIIMLTLQLVCGIGVIVLDSVYWVHSVMG